jgi:hypothetical protein
MPGPPKPKAKALQRVDPFTGVMPAKTPNPKARRSAGRGAGTAPTAVPGLMNPVQRLHAEIARLHPDGMLNRPGVLSLEIGTAVLDQTWDPTSDRLLDRSIYELVLDTLKPTAKQRQRVLQLYNAAAGATQEDWNEREEQVKRRQAQVRTAQRMLNAMPGRSQSYLADLSTERQFMNHLRSLRTRSGLSLRAIADRMIEIDKRAARSSTTLHTILNRDTVPRDINVVQTLISALISALPDGEFGNIQHHQALEDHLVVWRKLIDVREGANQRPEVVQTIIDALTMLIDVAEHLHEPEAAGLHLALRAAELAGDGHTLDDIKGVYQLGRIGNRLKVPAAQ